MHDDSHHLPPLPLRILTHNIRYATAQPFKGELPWPARFPLLLSQLKYHARNLPNTIICLQEVLHIQLLDIVSGLNKNNNNNNKSTATTTTTTSSDSTKIHPSSSTSPPTWTHLGVGRNDGRTKGEYAPIFFHTRTWTLLHFGTTWLSPTPTVPGSKGWDAASVRIVSVAVLSHSESGRRVLVLNTHLDDQGQVSRREAAAMLVRIAREQGEQWDVHATFVVGDLNSEVDGEAYRILNQSGSGLRDIRGLLIGDVGGLERESEGESGGGSKADETGRRYGNEMTFTGFLGKGDGDSKGKTRIDFIHLGVNDHEETQPVTIEGYAVLSNRFEDGVYMSDHRAVVADLLIR